MWRVQIRIQRFLRSAEAVMHLYIRTIAGMHVMLAWMERTCMAGGSVQTNPSWAPPMGLRGVKGAPPQPLPQAREQQLGYQRVRLLIKETEACVIPASKHPQNHFTFLHSMNPWSRNVELLPTGRARLGCSVVGFQARSCSDPRVRCLQQA